MYEWTRTNEVYIEYNNENHSDSVDEDLNINLNNIEDVKKKEGYGINQYFNDIINRIVIDHPNIQPMDIHEFCKICGVSDKVAYLVQDACGACANAATNCLGPNMKI